MTRSDGETGRQKELELRTSECRKNAFRCAQGCYGHQLGSCSSDFAPAAASLKALRITLDKVVAQLQGAQAICLLTASDHQNAPKCELVYESHHVCQLLTRRTLLHDQTTLPSRHPSRRPSPLSLHPSRLHGKLRVAQPHLPAHCRDGHQLKL